MLQRLDGGNLEIFLDATRKVTRRESSASGSTTELLTIVHGFAAATYSSGRAGRVGKLKKWRPSFKDLSLAFYRGGEAEEAGTCLLRRI